MELRQLRYFVRVVELGSMSRAALDLNLVQSALSQQISRHWRAHTAHVQHHHFIIISFGHYFSTKVRCIRTHINNMIRFPHHHFIMLYHYNGIAEVS